MIAFPCFCPPVWYEGKLFIFPRNVADNSLAYVVPVTLAILPSVMRYTKATPVSVCWLADGQVSVSVNATSVTEGT